jgi:hypothetical protein
MLFMKSSLRPSHLLSSRRSFVTKLPRFVEKRPNEFGVGGRASDPGFKVAIFGATGFLGRYVCAEFGM